MLQRVPKTGVAQVERRGSNADAGYITNGAESRAEIHQGSQYKHGVLNLPETPRIVKKKYQCIHQLPPQWIV